MPSRGRNYMDRLLGRNEGNESRDFTEGRRYGEEETFFDDRRPEYRTQASRNRPRPDFYKTAEERDYSTRRNPPEERSSRGSQYSSRESTNFSARGGFYGKGPKGYKRSDERIKDEVSEALYRDYHIDASEIEVDVKDGIVTLSGTVDSRQTKRAAEECIENLTGVSDVHNRIRIMDQGNMTNLRSGSDKGDEKRALS